MSAQPDAPITTLFFRPDNPCNTTIYISNPCGPDSTDDTSGDDNGDVDWDNLDIAYRVKTVYEPKIVSTLYAASATANVGGEDTEGEVIGSFEWREVRSDLVRFGKEGVKMSSGEWLKKSMVPFKDTVTLKHQDGKRYKWKGFSVGLNLELYSEADKSAPIARFIPSRHTRAIPAPATGAPSIAPILTEAPITSSSPTSPARLLLTQEASSASLMNTVLLSFLLLEKTRRAKEKSTNNHADSAATPMSRSYALTGGGA